MAKKLSDLVFIDSLLHGLNKAGLRPAIFPYFFRQGVLRDFVPAIIAHDGFDIKLDANDFVVGLRVTFQSLLQKTRIFQ